LPFALPAVLFIFLFSVYLLTYSPQFHSSDGLAVFATTESLARRGEWDADQIRWMGLGQGIFGPDGHLYVRKGIGVSLLSLPLVWLGLIIPIWGTATTALLFNTFVTAATGAFVLRYLQLLGYGDRVALVGGLIFGLATPAWPYAKTFFSDPMAALCLIAAALALLRFRQSGRIANAFWAGLALAFAIAARYANAVIIPLYGLLLLRYQTSNTRTARPDWSEPAEHYWRKCGKDQIRILKSLGWQAWVAFGAPLVAVAIAIGFYNLARYGDPLNTGYLPEESFSGVWWQGIAGMLVSPGRGLLLYAPVLLVALLAAPAFFRRHRAEAMLAWAIILVHVLLYGKWFMWHGGYAWGPRFIVPTLPFFVIGMAPGIEHIKEPGWKRLGFLALAILSGLIQILGLSVHFELFQTQLLDTGLPLFAPVTFFAPRYSPLVGQLQFLRLEYLDFVWIKGGRVDWLMLVTLAAAALLSGWVLIRIGRLGNWKVGRSEDWETRESSNFQTSKLPVFNRLTLPILLTLAATILLLARAHAFQPTDLRNAVAMLNARTTSADAVITGTPDESAAFADLYKGQADVLGLSAGSPFDEDTAVALAETVKKFPHVWWLPNWLPTQDISIEKWLLRHGFRAEESSFGEQRVVLFYFPPQPLVETTMGTTLGDAITLEQVATLPTSQPGDVLPVGLHWKAEQAILDNFHVFVHLLDADGNRVAQSDGQPALWTRPTSSWAPGELVEDRHALSLPTELPQGNYTLVAGLYLPESGERLPAEGGDGFVVLGDVQIRK
jgi:hypothetical protein